MGTRWVVSVEVDASPEAAWAIVGDVTAVPRFYPKYVGVEVNGDARVLTNAQGGRLAETLLERDDAGRIYSYSVVEGAPLRSHHASFEVQPTPTGSRIVWSTDAEPLDPAADLEARLRPTQLDALDRLKALIEGGA